MHIYRDFASAGGAPDMTRELAKAQVELGHQVVGVCSLMAERVKGLSLEIHRIKYGFRGFREIYKLIKSYRPEIVHIPAPLVPMDCLYGLFTKLICRVPVVVSPHGVLNPKGINLRFGGKQKSRLRTLLKRVFIGSVGKLLFRTMDAGHAHSEYEAEVLRGCGARNVMVIPFGVNKEWLATPKRTDNDFRTFTYFGRLDIYHKSLDLVLGAAKRVKDAGHPFKIRLVGSDVSGSFLNLKRSVELNNLTDVVTVEPRAGGMEKIMQETDFYLGAFRFGGMARACGGAIASGVPLIASRESCWGDWVVPGRFGIVSALNIQALSEALIQALEMSAVEYESMSERAYAYAKSLSYSFVAREFVRGYKICQERKGDLRENFNIFTSRPGLLRYRLENKKLPKTILNN